VSWPRSKPRVPLFYPIPCVRWNRSVVCRTVHTLIGNLRNSMPGLPSACYCACNLLSLASYENIRHQQISYRVVLIHFCCSLSQARLPGELHNGVYCRMATCRDICALLSGLLLRYLLFLEQTKRYLHRSDRFTGSGIWRHMTDDRLFLQHQFVPHREHTIFVMKLTSASVHTSQRTHCQSPLQSWQPGCDLVTQSVS
jgi:hypothetical protein